jgi:hypothetical protein
VTGRVSVGFFSKKEKRRSTHLASGTRDGARFGGLFFKKKEKLVAPKPATF